jgi:hypothetical protein
MKFHTVIFAWRRMLWLAQVLTLGATHSITFAAEPIESRGTYLHSFSHFSFPTNVETFVRVNLYKYDKDGRDVSAGYNLLAPPLALTIYIYPAPKNVAVLPQKRIEGVTEALLDGHFAQVKGDVQRAHSGVKVLSETAFELAQENNKRTGRRAVFAFQEPFAGLKQDLRSELYLFLLEPNTMFLINDRFYVMYRVSYPASEKESAEKEVQKFLRSFAWPTK